MINEDLMNELRSLVSASPVTRELERLESHNLVESVGRRFVRDVRQVWWWDSLKNESELLIYGESDGLAVVEELIPDDEKVWLVVTDDEARPWPVFAGKFSGILEILRESGFFEYFLVGEQLGWIVFDTHHNVLLVTGDLLSRARELSTSGVLSALSAVPSDSE